MAEWALRRGRKGRRSGKAAILFPFCQHLKAQVDTESIQTQRLFDGGKTVVDAQYFTVIVRNVYQRVCF